jgi:hypothetical protein
LQKKTGGKSVKKSAFKSGKGSSFRTYYHGNGKVNGCSFHRVKREAERQETGKKVPG